MALNDTERALVERQIADVERQIELSSNSRNGLLAKVAKAEEEEAFNVKNWLNYHSYVLNYEKEIEGMIGEYITSPFSELDVDTHASGGGRLYQGLVSSAPKVISQMVGGSIASTILPYELENKTELDEVVDVILNGKDFGFSAPAGITLAVAYTAGDGQFQTDDAPTVNHWYLLGGNAYVHVNSVTPIVSSVSTVYVSNIDEVYIDGNANIGGSVVDWQGYSNTERTTQIPTSTSAGMFNTHLSFLDTELEVWLKAITKSHTGVIKNNDPFMDAGDKQATIDLFDYITAFIASPQLQDGTPGIDELKTNITDRFAFIPTRVATARLAKEAHYPNRVNFTTLRADWQSGSLARIKFGKLLLEKTPGGGTPEQLKRLSTLKLLLEQE